jgi:hypothetical protein
MKPGGRGLRRAPGDEMASCKGRGSKTVCKALFYSADGWPGGSPCQSWGITRNDRLEPCITEALSPARFRTIENAGGRSSNG